MGVSIRKVYGTGEEGRRAGGNEKQGGEVLTRWEGVAIFGGTMPPS